MAYETIAARLAATNNRPAGFDYLRLALATAVVGIHTLDVCFGVDHTLMVWHGPFRPAMAMILPMFFALSGFLVAGSLARCRTMVSFLGLRVIRLVPALVVDTAVAALLIGPFFTAVPLADYFASPMLPAYALNIVGDIHYRLPGVFLTNPWPGTVNAQLWTLPYELMCYGSLTALAVLGTMRARRTFLICVAGIALMAICWFVPLALERAAVMNTPMPPVLVVCFLAGVTAHLFRDRLPWDRRLFGLSLALSMLLLVHPVGDLFAVLPVTYVTVYLGLLDPRRIGFIASGDYSYGLFLYGFPVQQAVVAVLGPDPWYVNLALSYAVTMALAMFSWHCVEAPAMRLRPYLYALEAAIVRMTDRMPVARLAFRPPLDGGMPAA